MLGLPPAVTAATGMDALTHAVEAYVSTIANAETDGFARAAVRLIFRHLKRAYDDGSDREARQGMALASTYAGLAFTRALVGYVHAIAHNFDGMYHTPHGLANAIILPHVLDYSAPPPASRLAEAHGTYAVPRYMDREQCETLVPAC
jgi:alcohol dehydrogenase